MIEAEEKVWYLAHPGASDEKYSRGENLAHVLKVARICWDAGFRVVLPWHTHFLFLDDMNRAEREGALAANLFILSHTRRAIFTGHKFSKGMDAEFDYLVTFDYADYIDATGIPDRDLPAFMAAWAERLKS